MTPRRRPGTMAPFAAVPFVTAPFVAVLAGAALLAGCGGQGGSTPAPPVVRTPVTAVSPAAGQSVHRGGPLGGIEATRAHLAQAPRDWSSWSVLGALEIEQGRVTGDPAAYAAAQAAFDTSLTLHPGDNGAALAGRATLSAAKHEFAAAEQQAGQALAVAPNDPQALAALTDALTELGRYDEALATGQRLDATRPGPASFSRLSYQAELRGRTDQAVQLMRRAADEAGTPAQVAFARGHEGLLLLGRGDLAAAQAAWRQGVALAPTDADLTFLGARIAWAQGDRSSALNRYAELVSRRPTPAYAAVQAEALAAAGKDRDARAALELARAGQQLARNAGVVPEAGDVLLEADHGDPARAVRLGADLQGRTRSVGAADAYAWALHRAGRDAEALDQADRALSLGGRPALALAHRGLIRASLGRATDAVTDLHAALAADPTFSALLAPQVEQKLQQLEGYR